MVVLLVRMNHSYEAERRELEADLQRATPQELAPARPITVVLVEDLDHETVHALQYAKTIRVSEVVAAHLETDPLSSLDLETAWEAPGLAVPLKVLRGHGDPASREGRDAPESRRTTGRCRPECLKWTSSEP
jgi:hypothetical protein